MARFKYWLQTDEAQQFALLTDEPKGVDGLKITLKRDNELRGLFYNIMAGLVFWGDGYELLMAKLREDGPCGYANFRLEVQYADYGSYDLLYRGRIPLSEEAVEIDRTQCTITADVVDENFSSILLKYKDAEITLGKELTISGESQPNINSICDFHNVDTGIYDWTGRTVYFVKDALDYIVRYLTDNELTVSSNYLTAGNFQPYIVEVHFQNGATTGDVITYEWTNSYGQQLTHTTTPIDNSVSGEFLENKWREIVRNLLSAPGAFVDGQNYMDDYFIWGGNFDCAGATPPTKQLFHGWTKGVQMTRVSVHSGPTTPYDCIITECQPFEYTGAYPFVIANMRRVITDPSRSVITTFKQLMQTLTACFGVAFRFTNDGSGPVMQVEQINDFFENTQAIKLAGVTGDITNPSSELIYNSATVGEQNYAEELMFRPETWVNPFCLGNKFEGQRPYAATARYFDNDQQDQNIIVHVEPNGSDWKTVQHVERSFVIPPGTADLERFWFNAPLININCLYKNEYLLSGNLKKDGLTYVKSAANGNLVLKTEFEHQVTRQQIRALIDNPVNRVDYDNDSGWIQSVEIDIETNIAKFVLLSEFNL